jgi:transcriptional regulator with XRE-family HTH domain
MPVEPAPSRDLRRTRFGAFVARALEAARERGMTVADIEAVTGLGNTTFYRWKNGNWNRDPRASEVRAFCAGLGLSIAEAYRALGWSEDTQARGPEPITEDPDVRAVLRALNDPNVHPAVKLLIRRQLRSMAQEAKHDE